MEGSNLLTDSTREGEIWGGGGGEGKPEGRARNMNPNAGGTLFFFSQDILVVILSQGSSNYDPMQNFPGKIAMMLTFVFEIINPFLSGFHGRLQ